MENNWFLKIEFLEKSLESAEEENRKLKEEINGYNFACSISQKIYEEEIERLKGLVEKAHDYGYHTAISTDFSDYDSWEQFKEENNINH